MTEDLHLISDAAAGMTSTDAGMVTREGREWGGGGSEGKSRQRRRWHI